MLLVIGYWGVFKFLGCFEFLSVKKFFVYWCIGILVYWGEVKSLVIGHWGKITILLTLETPYCSYRKRGFNLV